MTDQHDPRPSRRAAAIGLVLALTAGPALAKTRSSHKGKKKSKKPAGPPHFVPSPDDMSLGKADAPVTVVEYASVGCPHCAHWDDEVFDAFKAKYIDTGQVRFVYRELLTGSVQLAAAGFMTARCAPAGQYFTVVRDVYRQQEEIVTSGEIRTRLQRIAQAAGLDETAWNACLASQTNLDAVKARSDANGAIDHIEGTPAFVINGVKLTTEPSLEGLGKAIAAAKAKTKA